MEIFVIVEFFSFAVLCGAATYMVKKAKEDRVAITVLSLLFLLLIIFMERCAPRGSVCEMVGQNALPAVATLLLVRFSYVGSQITEKLLGLGLLGLFVSTVAFVFVTGTEWEKFIQKAADIFTALSMGLMLGWLDFSLPVGRGRRCLK
ncbi:hypothetical protein HMPREF9081_1688 [Centipeda periodontii DSM 2778]|uniref:Uncharacterized protein n=1 Tax=Centipeda periodontii DSM 2778 TaxID=888060 RepID=F5RN52_9FIRM|nr:hypothetical protein [Centipeda periodontii]EGK59184.1 hypothetical protein HMPREF9081_1688 [Centipeda periodontii DSM 2778]